MMWSWILLSTSLLALQSASYCHMWKAWACFRRNRDPLFWMICHWWVPCKYSNWSWTRPIEGMRLGSRMHPPSVHRISLVYYTTRSLSLWRIGVYGSSIDVESYTQQMSRPDWVPVTQGVEYQSLLSVFPEVPEWHSTSLLCVAQIG